MIKSIQIGHVLSETSHYVVTDRMASVLVLKHVESNDTVNISNSYAENYLISADEVLDTVKVGKEDKLWTAKQIDEQFANLGKLSENAPKVGDLKVKGIRTIWQEINSPEVFTVCFKKQDKPKSAKKIKEETDAKALIFAEEIDKIKTAKKGVADAAKAFITELVKNPILPYEEGEERILRGYKIQFESRDGKYNCVDMDIIKTDKESGLRPVNINSISWLIYKGVKYIVE